MEPKWLKKKHVRNRNSLITPLLMTNNKLFSIDIELGDDRCKGLEMKEPSGAEKSD